MVVFFVVERWIAGFSAGELWRTRYFLPGWQAFFDLFNSVPLILLGVVAAWAAGKPGLMLFFASMLLHAGVDFLLHASDAHRHLFPLSDYRFHSPVSYWDPRHFGRIVAPVEGALTIGLGALCFRHTDSRGIRASIVAVVALYALGAAALLMRIG